MKKTKNNLVLVKALVASLVVCASPAFAAGYNPVYMEDMTWMEIRERIQQGARIAIVPTGGTEQHGPHLTISKHNVVVRYTAGEIAKRLGDALVAPVLPFAPSGRIDPPEGHMQFSGTVSLSEEGFARALEDIAGSLKQHGFHLIAFVGDHGGSQRVQDMVAARLSEKWQSSGVRVINVSNYYSQSGADNWAQSIGVKVPNVTAHAGLSDASEVMAIDTQSVRPNQLGARGERDYRTTGAMGDSSQASAGYGRRFLSLKIEAAVEQISNASARTR